MAMSWHTMMDFEPPIVGCVISNRDYTFSILKQTKECVINIPTVELAPKVGRGQLHCPPLAYLLLQRTEVSLHPVDPDGQAVFQREVLGMLREHGGIARLLAKNLNWRGLGSGKSTAESQNARRYRNSGTTRNGLVVGVIISPAWSISPCEALPRNLEPSRICTIRSGSNPISLEQVTSAATGSSASTIFPRRRAAPLRGPLPSVATMPSAITKWIGTVAHKS